MHMKAKLLKLRLFTVSVIILMLIGLIPQAVWASQSMEREEDVIPQPFEGYDLDGIYLFYDSTDEIMSAVADGVHEIASFRINNIMRIPTKSPHDIEFYLSDEPWIGVYALRSNLTHVMFPDYDITWQQFYKLLREHRSSQHVVGMGNTLSLDRWMTDGDSRIYHSESEQIDGLVLILYDIWAIKEICTLRATKNAEYGDAANDLEKMALQIYADNFNALFQRSVDPVNPVGQVDPLAAEKRAERMWAEHTPEVREAAYTVTSNGSLEAVPVEETPEDFSPMMRLGSPADVVPGDFILGEIPLLSGLRGPIGKIVDVLLDVLAGAGKTVLSIPSGALDSLKGVFEEILPFLGIVSDFDLESPLKSIINGLADQFPFGAELKGYLTPILKALFNLRGDLSSITDVFEELLTGLLPAIIPDEVMTFLDSVLDIGGGLWNLISDVVTGGKDVFDAILSFMMDNVLTSLLNKTLVASLGVAGDVTDLLSDSMGFIKSIVNYLSTFDFTRFITDVGDNLITNVLGLLGDAPGQEVVGQIMNLVKLGFTAVEQIDTVTPESLIQILTQTTESFIDPSDITGDPEDFSRALMNVTKKYSEQGLTSLSAFQDELDPIFDEYVASGVPTEIIAAMTDTVSMIAGFFNDGFPDADLPDIFDIAETLVNQLSFSSAEYTTADAAEIMDAFHTVLKPVLGAIASITGDLGLKRMITGTLGSFASEIGSIPGIFLNVIQFLDTGNLLDGLSNLESVMGVFGEIAGGAFNLLGLVRGQSFGGIMNTLLMAVGSIFGTFPQFDNVPIDAMLKLMQSFFPDAFGFDLNTPPDVASVIAEVLDMVTGSMSAGILNLDMIGDIVNFFMDIKGIFTDGILWIMEKVYDWVSGMLTSLLQNLEDMVNGVFGGMSDLLGYAGKLPIGLGEWSLFDLIFDLGIRPQFAINEEPLLQLIEGVLLKGRAVFSLGTVGEFLSAIFSFFEITPQFYAELGVSGFDSSKNKFMEHLLSVLGVDLQFSGYAKFVINLFSFRNGMFEWREFLSVKEWVMSLKVALERTFTLLDFLTGGVGGSVLNKLASYIGLNSINVKVWFSLELDIVRKAATATGPMVATLSLVTIIGASMSLGIDIIVASAKLYGSLEIAFSFFQDFAKSSPMKIMLRLTLTLKLKIKFLFAKWKKTWTWQPGGPWDLSPNKGEAEYENTGVGFDSDNDGLSDDYENDVPGLDPNNPDTDGDGANDKLEVMTMGSDPVVPDTDEDGLLDGEEWELGTNPLRVDSDYDGISDFDEVRKYGTDALTPDTDGDGLTDRQEIYTSYNMTDVWVPAGTAIEVYIGGELFTDHTDPLVADTDGDGLVDGDEGPSGAYYGLPSLYNDTEETEGSGDWVMDPNPLIFNGGYTHPLDPDTDDDSYLQLYNGDVDSQALTFLKDMNDGAEVAGFWIIVYDDEGEPEDKQVFTNPCNPDTDGDTGITDRTPQPGAWINSDGYELAQTPPSDPTDGDTDDDGLLDGLEGVLRQDSNHTDYLDADTDDDGLFDMQEILLGTDPRCQDSDFDMISDGDEFYKFFTDPTISDSDFDGLSDGEEVFFWHSNPLIDDSDGDGILDGREVLKYGSDPMDEDSDNDGLTDFEEIMIYYTDPFSYDSDSDGLSDGEEILYYGTNPLAWDTDNDTITHPNELGEFSWPMSDYDEVMIHGTNATEADSDLDGLSDAYELYLGSGLIPWMDPIPLDPMDYDTDDDWLSDGSELVIENISTLLYPFQAPVLVFRYNTSPVLQDTDNDTLIDYQEVMVFNSNPASNDSDNDTLPDWNEIWVYNTSAISNDTDGDGLLDNEETLYEVYPYGDWPPVNWSIGMTTENEPEGGGFSGGAAQAYEQAQTDPVYESSATDPDSDDDWLPDGAEVFFYETEPMDDDSDGDGRADTYEFDTDYDALPDGLEFKLGLQTIPGGGIMSPDSDLDGLLDGDEYYVYGTDPGNRDTDGDGYSDGLEIALGLDPLTNTTKDEFEMALAYQRGKSTLKIMTPANGTEVYQNTAVSVANFTPFQEVWFKFQNGSDWSEDYQMEYNPGAQQWQSNEIKWSPGTYTLRVYALNNTGVIHAATVTFVVIPGTGFMATVLMAAAIVGLIAVVAIVGYVGHRKGWWSRVLGGIRRGGGVQDYGLELSDLQGVGATLEKRLKEGGFDSVSKIAEADSQELGQIKGLSTDRAENMIEQAQKLLQEAKDNAEAGIQEGGA
ncbi:MAG: hypothetical protein GF309_01170 [Candidatus Lokiarchaeota archaeon]|nr:hypothetical protein [Candidatus Lokiarchaeota archaeon]